MRSKKDRLNSPAHYWACNDKPWCSSLFISSKKPFSASLLPARSLCQSRAQVLHFITLGCVLRTAEIPHGLVLAGPQRCLHKFSEILCLQQCFFPDWGVFQGPKLSWAQSPPSPCGGSVLCSQLPLLQRRQELGNLVSPPYPDLCLALASRSMCIPE